MQKDILSAMRSYIGVPMVLRDAGDGVTSLRRRAAPATTSNVKEFGLDKYAHSLFDITHSFTHCIWE